MNSSAVSLRPKRLLWLALALTLGVAGLATNLSAAEATGTSSARKKIVFISGKPSHGYMSHGHLSGCLLLAKSLEACVPNLETMIYKNEWPKDPGAFDGVAAIVIFCDGGGGHLINPHLEQVERLMQQGVGLACLHYAVEVPKGKEGDALKEWIGGYFETHWSVNPFWKAEFKTFPDHPVARGLKPFAIEDEWYYHMRFRDNMEGVTPILSAVPPDRTRENPDGPHSGNPTVRARKGMAEILAWTNVRANGGRGFGFTGGHFHWSWANDYYRKVVLNGIAWTAGIEIPATGLVSPTPDLAALEAHQEYPAPENFDREKIQKQLEQWRKESAATP